MNPILRMTHVERRYGSTVVLSDADLEVHAGEVVGLIGPNGSGKTTMLRIAAGLLSADDGTVTRGSEASARSRRPGIGYFAGEATIPGALRERRWRALFTDVDGAATNRTIRLLSRGTRQLLGLRTVLGVPGLTLLLLDEPWEGLDPDAARWLTLAIRSRQAAGAAVIVSSHRLHDLAGVCDQYVFLYCGRTTSKSAADLQENGMVTGDTLLTAFDRVRGGPR